MSHKDTLHRIFELYKQDRRMVLQQRAAEYILYNSTATSQCSECGFELEIESDRDMACPQDGCDGRIVSPAIQEGLI